VEEFKTWSLSSKKPTFVPKIKGETAATVGVGVIFTDGILMEVVAVAFGATV
jgi:hypothetical protein